jgi:hypothetical protein
MELWKRTHKGRLRAASRGWALGIGAVLVTGLGGCGPDMNAVANRLRKENQEQKSQIADLQDRLKNAEATVRDIQARMAANNPPLPTLPPERLAQVFTASKLEFQSQTEAQDLGDGRKGFRVFLRTYADGGQVVPATGALTIEAFELPPAPAEPRRIGVWNFTAAQMKAAWRTELWSSYFVFSCPWEAPPTRENIVLKARLEDALTGRTLEAQLDKKITPLP